MKVASSNYGSVTFGIDASTVKIILQLPKVFPNILTFILTFSLVALFSARFTKPKAPFPTQFRVMKLLL